MRGAAYDKIPLKTRKSYKKIAPPYGMIFLAEKINREKTAGREIHMARKIVVTSGKGGVGKTTVAANLGAQLSRRGERVILCDTDFGLNNMDVVTGVENLVVYDIVDVIEEETTEDFEKMAAILPSDKPYLKTGVFETWRSRIPWLMLLMLSATFTGIIITSFESALAACVVLTSFIPMLSGTGGNSGSQSSVAVIRALSLGEIEFSDMAAVVWKEIRVSVLCGLCLAVANFAKMMLVDHWLMHNPEVTPMVALVVCLTLVFTVLCAKVVGCTLPMVAEKIGIDPAVMASPFITTIVDALSLLIYFFFATRLLAL